ncbi:MAG: hypothetical protein ACAH89_01880 [Rariglobus sp.]|nr:hypothetical protein [Rariglobus sp.]
MQFSAKRRSKGFALLITITLLAFLVLLLVSLASLTRVETQVASNNQQLAQARQNALMALNIALGELQKYAGPDQRTTARSDMMDITTPPVYTAPSGRWLGVYGRGVATADTAVRDIYTDIPSKISLDTVTNSDANGRQAILLNWLISGNEGTAFNPATTIDPNGQIDRSKAPTSFAFTPAGTVNLGSTPTALSTNITITGGAGTRPASLLVGGNSVTAASDYVAAPLVDITVAPSVLPSIGGTTNITVGRYAWWVGDEGAKARINQPQTATTSADKANAFVMAPRPAIELVDAIHPAGSTASFATTDLIGNAYNPTQTNIASVMNPSQLPMLTPASATALSAAAKYRFHDLTGHSTSILSDTYAGGLKKDLSAVLGKNHGPTTPADTAYLFPPEPNTASYKTNEFMLPTWAQLRSFVQTTATSAGLVPRLSTMAPSSNPLIPIATNVGIAPIMTYGVIGFKYIAPLGDTVGQPIQLAVMPVVVLWNPYNNPIRGTDDSGNPTRFQFGMKKAFASWIQLQGRDGTDSTAWGPDNVIESVDLQSSTPGIGGPYLRFIIDCSEGIPPGQSLVYTLQNNAVTYDGTNVLKNSPYHPLYYALLPARSWVGKPVVGSPKTPTAAGGIYRVGVNASAHPTTDIYEVRKVNGVDVPATFWNKSGVFSTDGNFGGAGNGWHEAYLGAVTPAAGPFPTGAYPWVGGSFTSQNLYQNFTMIGAPFVGTPPYGTGSVGYAASSGATGLVQGESTLATFVDKPAFRMSVFNQFSRTPANLTRSRWLVNTNPRGFMSVGNGNFTGQPTSNNWPPDLGNPGSGLQSSSCTALTDSTGPVDGSLFEFRPDSMPLLTLGQLQHANLGWNAGWPAYAIGNSNNGSSAAPEQLVKLGAASGNAPGSTITASYSFSWLLNRVMWDRYFVSTVPYEGTGTSADTDVTSIPPQLPNGRHVLHNATRTDPDIRTKLNVDQAAAHLLLSGGFNINSTSVQAWRAVLGGSNQLNYDPTGSSVGGAAWPKAVFSRFSKPTTNRTLTSSDPNDAWKGYRQLTEEQIAQLAANIVAEIRNRGPFISLSDFINRRLVAAGAFPKVNDPRLKGTIQAALDATTSGSAAINNGTLAPFNGNLVTGFFGASTDPFATGSSTPSTPTAPYGSAAAFAPQFLTQADVLSSIGSGLSARSDTFTIRTYGETNNPALGSADPGYISARAWCEAVVQRIPDYVDPVTDPNTYSTPTAAINKTMGRRFKIISFRWLSSNDI